MRGAEVAEVRGAEHCGVGSEEGVPLFSWGEESLFVKFTIYSLILQNFVKITTV